MRLPEGVQSTLKTVSTIADWFLIVAGAVMMLKGWFRVDLIEAQYLLVFCGGLLLIAGCWFRYRSWRKK